LAVFGVFLPSFHDTNPQQWYFWVETKGRTLEEIDALFEGEKHSSVPDVETVRTNKATIDVAAIEQELHEEKLVSKME
jgi:hypothetical protein